MASSYTTDAVISFFTGERPFPAYLSPSDSEVESTTYCDDKASNSLSLEGEATRGSDFELEEVASPDPKLPRLEVCSSEGESEMNSSLECEVEESEAQFASDATSSQFLIVSMAHLTQVLRKIQHLPGGE